MEKVTLKDLARELGVSTTLISRVINASRQEDGTLDCDISQGTAQRVLRAVKAHNYKPSRTAAGLRSGKRYMIGVVTPDISNYAFSEAGRYIEELAHNDGYSVMFGSSAESPRRLEEILDIFMSHEVDGMIITPCAGSEEILGKVLKRKIPLVLINRDVPGLKEAGRVFLDNILSMNLVVNHLIGNGYRRIEMISENMDVLSLRDREKGYRDTHPDGYDNYYGLQFSDAAANQCSAPANHVLITYAGGKTTSFTYDEATGTYTGMQYGSVYSDNNETTLHFKNVLILNADTKLQEDGLHLTIDLVGQGTGFFCCGGKYTPIYWQRPSDDDSFHFYTTDWEPLSLGVGKTFVSVQQVGSYAGTTDFSA